MLLVFCSSKQHRWIWKLREVPYNMTVVSGEVHVALSREFVNFIIYSDISWRLLQWVHDAAIPDEIFFSTLNYNSRLGVPGTIERRSTHHQEYLTRYKVWMNQRDKTKRCHGKYVRNICIFGLGDLPALDQVPHMFVNKLHIQYQYLTLDCLEQRYFKHVQIEYEQAGVTDMNMLYREQR
ncbi:unnamed protein product [Owenia fusiformis]|uniref:Uncharacterized protein n=1 Tax=Owenia fusiformis TaxID=6347 RepID=A0A8S4NJH9_OWEFU|nr:unnamed protein product [Owenia fusiformis]